MFKWRTKLAGGLLLVPLIAVALETDKQQPVQWQADGDSSMRTEGERRLLEMQDNVQISQGSLQINGDHAILEYLASTNELVSVTVSGSPVRYQQQLDNGGLVSGSSETLLLYTDELDGQSIIELTGAAIIQTGDSTMRCAAIVYVADQDIIRQTTGPCDGSFGVNGDP